MQDVEDYSSNYVERDERRLADLGRRAVEVYAVSYILRELESVHSMEESIKRQDALIKEVLPAPPQYIRTDHTAAPFTDCAGKLWCAGIFCWHAAVCRDDAGEQEAPEPVKGMAVTDLQAEGNTSLGFLSARGQITLHSRRE